MLTALTVSTPPGEWIRIFACQLARRRPTMSAEAAIDTAIAQYRTLWSMPPERAAANHCDTAHPKCAEPAACDQWAYFGVPDTGGGVALAGACAAERSRTFSR